MKICYSTWHLKYNSLVSNSNRQIFVNFVVPGTYLPWQRILYENAGFWSFESSFQVILELKTTTLLLELRLQIYDKKVEQNIEGPEITFFSVLQTKYT